MVCLCVCLCLCADLHNSSSSSRWPCGLHLSSPAGPRCAGSPAPSGSRRGTSWCRPCRGTGRRPSTPRTRHTSRLSPAGGQKTTGLFLKPASIREWRLHCLLTWIWKSVASMSVFVLCTSVGVGDTSDSLSKVLPLRLTSCDPDDSVYINMHPASQLHSKWLSELSAGGGGLQLIPQTFKKQFFIPRKHPRWTRQAPFLTSSHRNENVLGI